MTGPAWWPPELGPKEGGTGERRAAGLSSRKAQGSQALAGASPSLTRRRLGDAAWAGGWGPGRRATGPAAREQPLRRGAPLGASLLPLVSPLTPEERRSHEASSPLPLRPAPSPPSSGLAVAGGGRRAVKSRPPRLRAALSSPNGDTATPSRAKAAGCTGASSASDGLSPPPEEWGALGAGRLSQGRGLLSIPSPPPSNPAPRGVWPRAPADADSVSGWDS